MSKETSISDSDLKKLLTDDRLDMIELGLQEPNLFQSLRLVRQEVRHSNFLAWILDPQGSHGLGFIFLRKFIRDIFDDEKCDSRTIFDADSMNYDSVEIRREWNNIDILIVFNEDVIMIENKIDSQDHYNQLQKYSNILKTKFPKHKKHHIYLSPFKDTPTDKEAAVIFTTYSYEEISKNIENLLITYKKKLSERVIIYIEDYLMVIRRYILMNEKLNDLAISLYKDHKEALDFIIENKPDIQKFIKEYLCELIEKNSDEYGIELDPKDFAGKSYIRFSLHDWDKFLGQKSGNKNWVPSGRVLVFEFVNIPNSLILKLTIGPGNDEFRQQAHKIALNNPKIFIGHGKKLTNKYTQIFRITFLSKDQLKRITKMDDETKTIINNKFKSFLNEVLPKIKTSMEKGFNISDQ